MPAFVTNGPDIPERLLQEHEEGRVVFFCGAGISNPAGLPDFCGLVNAVYTTLHATMTPIEKQAYENRQYDAILDQLERRYPGHRFAVRTALTKALKPNWHKKGAVATHQALLQLSTDRKGKVRLVTTNFDNIFQRVIKRHKLDIPSFSAPLLPIPKPTRWHGVVHLHGLLPESPDEMALNRLVLTSGDFGLAYLTERWAARFVSELFRNYTVCFVGYGINDPVLRYMMDALAADELLGETRPEGYAFAGFCSGRKESALIEWKSKGITPLLYEALDTQDHSALHRTLGGWADTYRDGVHGKEMIVAQHASTPPLGSSRSDFAVGRMLWALTDGLAAKHFAYMNPAPPLEWLEPLAELQFGHEDLSRFGVIPKTQKDNKLSFSFIQRPTPYTLAPTMSIADMGARGSRLDEVMFTLAHWLTRHLDDPKLVLWLAKQGGQLNEQFAWLVQKKIENLDRLVQEGKQDELDQIRAGAPMAIPGPLMRTLWRLFLSGRVKSAVHDFDLYDWLQRFKQDGLTPTLRMELRELLTPRVILSEPFHWDDLPANQRVPKRIKDLVEWEIVLSCNDVHSALNDRADKPYWQTALPHLLQDFNILLRDTLDLMRELGYAEDKSDLSYVVQPSISKHPQNRGFRDWTALIELTRDAWLSLVQAKPIQASHVAEGWWQLPYPLFKRMAFFAAANSDVISRRWSLDWILADGDWWLWAVETQREVMRLIVALSPKLDTPEMIELEQAILQGPPREMFRADIEPEEWIQIVDREVWLRFAKIEATGAMLGKAAKSKLVELSQKYPVWHLMPDESDEFPSWIGEGDEWKKFVATPRRWRELMEWLKQPSTDPWQQDDWRARCSDHFSATACALCGLAREDNWPTDRWRDALQAWAEEKLLKRSWRYMARVIVQAPDVVLAELSHGLSWWLQSQAKTFDGQEGLFFLLIRRLLALEYKDEDQTGDPDPVSRAINRPIGHATEALLHWWYRQKPEASQGLLDELRPLFTQLCDTSVDKFRHGRVLLAGHTITLFRVDEEWTKTHLLPLFDWQRSEAEARAVWEGFLWSPRLYRPLLTAIKQPLLETARHYDRLGRHAEQYADFLAFISLDPSDTFSIAELTEATRQLPSEGLQSSADAVRRALEGAGQHRKEYWRNRVRPYLESVWPKTQEAITPLISKSLARLCVAAGEAFPEALADLRYLLQPIEDSGFLLHLMSEAKLCEQFPSEALVFMDIVTSDDAKWSLRELKQCMDSIESADRELAKDARFIRLTNLYRRYGTF